MLSVRDDEFFGTGVALTHLWSPDTEDAQCTHMERNFLRGSSESYKWIFTVGSDFLSFLKWSPESDPVCTHRLLLALLLPLTLESTLREHLA